MTKQRLYHSNFNHHGHKRGKANRSRAHNLRAKAILENLYTDKLKMEEICDFTLTKNNVLYIPDENGKLKPANAEDGESHYNKITSRLDREKKEYLNNLESAFNDSNKAELSDKRAKAKAALKRYEKGSEDDEAKFWQGLTERLGSDEIDAETEISNLKNCSAKIKRFNQKVQRIKELSEYNQLLGVKSRNTEYTIFSKELVYKFPDNTSLNIKPLDLANFANNISKKLYPDFDATYLVIHCDENPDNPHAHIEYSGRNKKTGEMDIQQQVFLNLKKVYKEENKVFPFENKNHYNDLTFPEVQRFGEIYQDFIFEKMNKYLAEKKYNANLEKRTAVEKFNDFEKFKDKHRPSQKREFTRANKIKEENKAAENKLNKTNDALNKLNDEVDLKNKESFKLDQKIDEKKEERNRLEKIIKSIKELIPEAVNSAVQFAFDNLPSSLFNYRKKQESLDKINKFIGDKVHNISIDEQPTDKQKQDIKNSRRKARRKPWSCWFSWWYMIRMELRADCCKQTALMFDLKT